MDCQPYAPAAFTQGNTPGTHFCQRLSQPQDLNAARKIVSKKNSNETIGNRTRDLLTCSGVPQPTAPPCAHYIGEDIIELLSAITHAFDVALLCANQPYCCFLYIFHFLVGQLRYLPELLYVIVVFSEVSSTDCACINSVGSWSLPSSNRTTFHVKYKHKVLFCVMELGMVC